MASMIYYDNSEVLAFYIPKAGYLSSATMSVYSCKAITTAEHWDGSLPGNEGIFYKEACSLFVPGLFK